MPNYLNDLGIRDADPSEVINLCGIFFSSGRFTNDREAAFGRVQGEIALVIRCNEAGIITAVEPGPMFRPADIRLLRDQIERELLTPGPLNVERQIIFTSAKIEGAYRSGDQFQILPVAPDSPQPEYTSSDFPAILEVGFISSSDLFVSHTRGTKKLNEIELSLIPLLPPLVRLQPLIRGRVWTNGPGETTLWRQDYAQVGYVPPSGPSDAFTDTSALPPMERVHYQDYYKKHQGHPNVFKLPDSLERSLAKISRLSPDNHRKYIRSAYWLKQAGLADPLGNSTGFVALISAVEALMGQPVRTGTCDTCNQAISIGNTALFKTFIDEHTSPGTVPNKLKNDFYNMRSAVAHGGNVFRRDLDSSDRSLRGDYERHRFMTLHDLVRIIVYNWLQQVVA